MVEQLFNRLRGGCVQQSTEGNEDDIAVDKTQQEEPSPP